MRYISIDLGTTNIKAAIYDDGLVRENLLSAPVEYDRCDGCVEFDADEYFRNIVALLAALGKEDVGEIVLTGQAESLVILDCDNVPLMNAISWMDERSTGECGVLAGSFSPDVCYSVTGQKAVLPTWPATKILHVKKHRADIYNRAAKYVLLKDYIAFRLCGVLACECSIATFTFYFDIHKKQYWQDMLNCCGINIEQLPPLVEPCTVLGKLLPDLEAETGMSNAYVNSGLLDHFAGMIGTGNIHPGILSETTGTVLALATMAGGADYDSAQPALHYGPFPGSYVFLPVAESGGVSLEWFKRQFISEVSFVEIDKAIAARGLPGDIIFLPYITGTNAPEYDSDACGLFYGIRERHDAIDFAAAVMEGVALVLNRNLTELGKSGISFKKIVSTGGGAKSDLWCQIKADITALEVETTCDNEATCLGAAIVGAVSRGRFRDYDDAIQQCVKIRKRFTPQNPAAYGGIKQAYNILYDAMLQASRVMHALPAVHV